MSKSTEFFQVGGTLDPDAPSYIERPADDELLQWLGQDELCLVLAPRQMGKSSLMVRACDKLKNKGISTAIVDLQALSRQTEPENWFRDVIYQIGRSAKLKTDSITWWNEKKLQHDPNRRFMIFLEEVVLHELEGDVIVFVDEIDSILSLPFSDEFFTIIRETYTSRRPLEPHLRRLNFVFLGVATASSFIKGGVFNIGKKIILDNFYEESIEKFKKVFGHECDALINQIFYWTNGQPYLVQKLSYDAYSWKEEERKPERIDEQVKESFFNIKIENDTNLNHIQEYLLTGNKELQDILTTYWIVLREKSINYDENSFIHNRLLLSGIVRENNKKLVVANRIYKKVFNLNWILKHIDFGKYEDLLKENNSLKADIQQLQNSQANAEKENDRLKTDIQQLQNSQKENNSLKADIQQLQNSQVNAEKVNDSLRTNIHELKKNEQYLREKQNRSFWFIAGLILCCAIIFIWAMWGWQRAPSEIYNDKIAKIEKTLTKTKKEKSELSANIQELESTKKKIDSELKKKQDVLTEALKGNSTLTAKIEELKTAKENINSELKKNQDALIKAKEENTTLTAKLRNLEKTIHIDGQKSDELRIELEYQPDLPIKPTYELSPGEQINLIANKSDIEVVADSGKVKNQKKKRIIYNAPTKPNSRDILTITDNKLQKSITIKIRVKEQ